ncbi:tyrosine-type recombinase/integrase [Paenibacillus aurantiacus]|uniref:Tyrosine-type recombinase/integrase n=1 Tax=Paenibacillus aurantiacus TaxID=1936118 RepID=A0ABV5KQV4_9BACL
MASFKKIEAKNKKGYLWVCIKDGPADPVTGKRNQIKRRGETKGEAEARVDAVIRALEEDGIDQKKAKKLPFRDFAAEWLDVYSKRKVKKGTVRQRRIHIDLLNKHIGAVNIDKITHDMHQHILNSLSDENYSKSHITSVHGTASLIYKFAILKRYRKDNPAFGTTIPEAVQTIEELENDSVESSYLERHEVAEFLNAARKYGLPADDEIFNLMIFSGIRCGEMLVLKEPDFDFEQNEIRVTKTLYNPTGNMKKYELVPPKTKGSVRRIDIDQSVMQLIRNLIKSKKKHRMTIAHFDEHFHNGNFVFGNEMGYPMNHGKINYRIARIMRKTSIQKHVTSHTFRHTHISMLTEAGVDLKTIMARVGHDDPDTTLRIYTHVTDKMKKDARVKVHDHFKDILPSTILQEM